jgi:hypothetical protein
MENEEAVKYCNVCWTVEDIKNLCPEWSDEQAEDFLSSNEEKISELMIERGWEILESFIN